MSEQTVAVVLETTRVVEVTTGPPGLTGPPGPAGEVDSEVLADLDDRLTVLTTTVAGKVDDTDPRLSDARTPTAHTHAQSDVTGLAAALGDKAAAVHTHVPSDVTGLDGAIAAGQRLVVAQTVPTVAAPTVWVQIDAGGVPLGMWMVTP